MKCATVRDCYLKNSLGLTPNNFISILELAFYYSRVIDCLKTKTGGASSQELEQLREELRLALYDLDVAQKEVVYFKNLFRDTHGTIFGAVADFNYFRINPDEQEAGVLTIADVVENADLTGLARPERRDNSSHETSSNDVSSQLSQNTSEYAEFLENFEENLQDLLEFVSDDSSDTNQFVSDAPMQDDEYIENEPHQNDLEQFVDGTAAPNTEHASNQFLQHESEDENNENEYHEFLDG